jgi:hypothetical protein
MAPPPIAMTPRKGNNALSQCAGVGKVRGQALSPLLVFGTFPLLYKIILIFEHHMIPQYLFFFELHFGHAIFTIFQSVNFSLIQVLK